MLKRIRNAILCWLALKIGDMALACIAKSKPFLLTPPEDREDRGIDDCPGLPRSTLLINVGDKEWRVDATKRISEFSAWAYLRMEN